MSRTLFGLLVGIDQYRSPVPALQGCVNDIEALQALLEDFSAGGEFELNLRILKDAEATRGAVVEGFREHLSRAGREDVALFYYSGHGSQEDAPPEFWHIAPDRLDETLVCFDSRDEGQWDLADKELAVLIEEISRRNPHILCVLDCCHSGSGTRATVGEGLAVRRAPTDRRCRQIGTFVGGIPLVASSRADQSLRTDWVVVPSGKHVLLAACRSNETAKETTESGKVHGAFTAALLAALRQTCGSITYRDLLKRAEAQVRLRVSRQVPQIEASDPTDLNRPFLGGAVKQQRSYFTLRRDGELGWVIDGGAVHGISRPYGGETTTLAIFDLNTAPTDWRQLDAAVATADVEQVLPAQSLVRLQLRGGGIDNTSTYRAIVTGTLLPALEVYFTGHLDALNSVRNAIAAAGEGGGPSTFVREADSENTAELRVDAEGDFFRIRRRASDQIFVAEVAGLGENEAREVVKRLEHAARWEAVARLENPRSRLGDMPVKIIIYESEDDSNKQCWREIDQIREIRLRYRYRDGEWKEPQILIQLRNQGQEDVYCSLLWLGEDYSISSELIPSGVVRVPKDGSVTLNNGAPISGFVPNEKWRKGGTEVRDLLKLIVSTEQFDPTLLDQEELDRYVVTRAERRVFLAPRNALDRLSARIHYRGLSTQPSGGETLPDWSTSILALTVIRPLETAEIPSLGQN